MHTPGPLKDCKDALVKAVAEARETLRKCEASSTCHISREDHSAGSLAGLEYAVEIFDRHCGPKSTELAEGDLLGEALEVVKLLHPLVCEAISAGMPITKTVAEARNRAVALLSRLPEPKGGESC